MNTYPKKINHWINDREVSSDGDLFTDKINPADGKVLAKVVRGTSREVKKAVKIASEKFPEWSETSVIERADMLRKAAFLIQERKEEIAQIVHLETGKSVIDALGEVGGSIELGFFYAGEGRRYYGKVTTSAMPNRMAMVIRQPVGVCALIVPFNTPIANIAWKAFPALLCGNTCVLKAASDTPYTPVWFAKILKVAGLPSGVFNVIQGTGEEVGSALVEDERIGLISFTGSVETGKYIQKAAGPRLVKISLELGGKNPFVVCDDADIESAVDWAVLSAFSNAGQRCASGSRIIVFDSIYEKFRKLFIEKTKNLKIGTNDSDDFGPVISKSQLDKILLIIKTAEKKGARILTGGCRLDDEKHREGFYLAPTVLENVSPEAEISQTELFGPVTSLYKAADFDEGLKFANNSSFGLTSAIHTKSIHRIQEFINKSESGGVSVNGPTYGSEPHMPFGGIKNSSNGSREPGQEALDIYSNVKSVYIKHDPKLV